MRGVRKRLRKEKIMTTENLIVYFMIYVIACISMIVIYIMNAHREERTIDSDIMFYVVLASMFFSIAWPLVIVFVFIWNVSAIILRLLTRAEKGKENDE